MTKQRMGSRQADYRKQHCARWHSRSHRIRPWCSTWPLWTLINNRWVNQVLSKVRRSYWHRTQIKLQKNNFSRRVASTNKIRAQIHSASVQTFRLETRGASSILTSRLDWTALLGPDQIKLTWSSIRLSLMNWRTPETSRHPSCYSHQINFKLLSNNTMTSKITSWCSLHNQSPCPPSSRPSLTTIRQQAKLGDVESTAPALPEEQEWVKSKSKHSKTPSWTPVNGTCHLWEI